MAVTYTLQGGLVDHCSGACRDLSTKEVVFASIAGLRGSVSLIMAQAFVTESTTATPDARVRSLFSLVYLLLMLVLISA